MSTIEDIDVEAHEDVVWCAERGATWTQGPGFADLSNVTVFMGDESEGGLTLQSVCSALRHRLEWEAQRAADEAVMGDPLPTPEKKRWWRR